MPEDYVHCIGRTGRAGAQGEAVSLVCVDENGFLRDIERPIKREIPKETVPGFPEPPVARSPSPSCSVSMVIGQGRGVAATIATTRRSGGGGVVVAAVAVAAATARVRRAGACPSGRPPSSPKPQPRLTQQQPR